MAVEKKILDYDGLQIYDSHIKAILPVFDNVTITKNEQGKWQANSATSFKVTDEMLTIYNLEATPGISGELLIF